MRHRPAQLSGGQQQRVAIARALITRPEVVFADEPTGALDTRTGQGVLGLLRNLVDGEGQTVVMVTHDPVAAAYADRVLLLADGRVAGVLDAPSVDDVAEQLAHLGDEDMLRFALLSSRGRLGTYLGALITLFASSVLVDGRRHDTRGRAEEPPSDRTLRSGERRRDRPPGRQRRRRTRAPR